MRVRLAQPVAHQRTAMAAGLTVLVDPPRSGCAELVSSTLLAALSMFRVSRLVYVRYALSMSVATCVTGAQLFYRHAGTGCRDSVQ